VTVISNDRLMTEIDEMFIRLMGEAYPAKSDEPPAEGASTAVKVGFVDKLKLFDSGVKWVQVKNKIDPEQETDEFSKAREQYAGRARGGSSASAKRN
jgi:hypothetical protein